MHNPSYSSLVQTLMTGTAEEKSQTIRRLNDFNNKNSFKIRMAASRKKEILSNLKAISDCENARLCLSHQLREKLESELDPIAKEKARRLLENLDLDHMEDFLTDSAMARSR